MLTRLRTIGCNEGSTALIFAAIVIGAVSGLSSDRAAAIFGDAIDWTVLLLVFLLALEIPFRRVRLHSDEVRFLLTAWLTNFLLIPPIGFLFATFFLSGEPLLATGVFIYFLAPCTDWFLGFTRLARGNTALGSILIPINMATQLALYPVYLALFTRWRSDVDIVATGDTMIQWFVLPFGTAILVRLALLAAGRRWPGSSHLPARSSSVIPLVIAVLVLEIFGANIAVIADHLVALVRILAAVFCFFALTWFAAERISRTMAFAYPEHVLFTFTTAARNAPLMLGITVTAIPDQPLVYAALVIGMLVEFPHLTALGHLLQRQRSTVSFGTTDPARHRST
jgi:ACR3 family arsenite efflux pump ArsB